MSKINPSKPILVLLYGMSGSGKTSFARQLCTQMQAVHLQADQIRAELFENPTFNKEENQITGNLMNYMAGKFLQCGLSVVFDMDIPRSSQRRLLRNMATKYKSETVLVWFQIDPDTAFSRASNRDRRVNDDHFAQEMTVDLFRQQLSQMQNPENSERTVVVSGKHVFNMQKNAFFRELRQRHLIASPDAAEQLSKPGLVNLIPNPTAGRVDMSRRNINVR